MAGEVIFSQFTLSGTEDTGFNPALVDIVDQTDVSAQAKDAEQTVRDMGYYMQPVVNPNQLVSSKVGARELDQLTEGQVIPLQEGGKGPDKAIQVNPYGGKRMVTKLAYDWAQSNNTLKNADASVATAIAEFVDGIKDLRSGAMRDKAIEATRVLTQGFSVSAAYGPGSATPAGQSLFDTDHPYDNSASTFSNVLGGNYGTLNKVLSATSLQDMLEILTYGTRMANGDYVVIPDHFTLVIPRQLRVTAGSIINSPNQVAGAFAGTGSNSSLVNTFYFNENKVKFVVNSFLGTNTKKGLIGSDTGYYVMNAEAMKDQRALRYMTLNDGELEMWYDQNTKNRYVSYYHACAFDHFGAEAFVAGSLGTVA